MRTKSEFILTGAKPTNTTIDGIVYDKTKIYLQLPISDGNGVCSAEYEWGDHSNYAEHFKNLELPCEVLVDFEMVTTGKRQKTIIHDVKIKSKVQVKV